MILQLMNESAPLKTGGVLVVEGMSIMLGDGGPGCTIGNGITSRLCAIKGWTEDNHAVNGTTIDDLLANLSRIPAYNGTTHRNIIFGHPINDTGNKTSTPAQYKTKLTTLLTHMHVTKGWPKNRIYVIDGTYATSANWADYGPVPPATDAEYLLMITACGEACNEYGVSHEDLYDWMRDNIGDAGLDVYGRHPLDTVTMEIATYYARFID